MKIFEKLRAAGKIKEIYDFRKNIATGEVSGLSPTVVGTPSFINAAQGRAFKVRPNSYIYYANNASVSLVGGGVVLLLTEKFNKRSKEPTAGNWSVPIAAIDATSNVDWQIDLYYNGLAHSLRAVGTAGGSTSSVNLDSTVDTQLFGFRYAPTETVSFYQNDRVLAGSGAISITTNAQRLNIGNREYSKANEHTSFGIYTAVFLAPTVTDAEIREIYFELISTQGAVADVKAQNKVALPTNKFITNEYEADVVGGALIDKKNNVNLAPINGFALGSGVLGNGIKSVSPQEWRSSATFDFSVGYMAEVVFTYRVPTIQGAIISNRASSGQDFLGTSAGNIFYFNAGWTPTGHGSPSVLVAGVTYHVVYKIESTGIKFFLDGKLVATSPATTSAAVARNFSLLGDSVAGSYMNNGFVLHKCNLYADVLSDAEIESVMFKPWALLPVNSEDYAQTPITLTAANKKIPFSNTAITSGTFSVVNPSTGRKTLEMTTAGIAYVQNNYAFGTQVYEIEKKQNSANLSIIPIASSEKLGVATAGQSGYSMVIANNAGIYIIKETSGTQTNLLVGSDALALNTVYKIALSRNKQTGAFSVYVKGGAFTSWTLIPTSAGANPTAAEITHTACSFSSFVGSAGDRCRLLGHHYGALSLEDINLLYQ